jgi:hypothetical protein
MFKSSSRDKAEGRMDRIGGLAETIADEHREIMPFTLLGPMPAYNFLDVGAPAGA